MHRKGMTKAGKTKATSSGPLASKGSVEDTDLDPRESETAGQCLSHLCLSEHLSDISFVFEGNGDVKLPAHKCILSMRSPVFEAMFYGKLAEEGCTIYIEDIEPETMKVLLRFVYSDNSQLNGENVIRCLYAAKKYALTGLVKQCSSFLENNIDTSNVSAIHEQAVFYDMRALQAKCFAYMLQNASQVFTSPGFLELSHSSLLSLLKDDELNMDEKDIFNAVLEWSKKCCKSKGKTLDARNPRECLGEALFEIRFPNMAIEEFASVISPTGILTLKEQIMLYEFNAMKRSSKLSKFKSKERSTKGVTIDVSKYISTQGRGFSYENAFQIQYQHNQSFGYYQSQRQLRNIPPLKVKSAPLKVKSFTGTFVENVTGITHGNVPLNYRIVGNKISFQTPVDLYDRGTIEFHQDENENSHLHQEYLLDSCYVDDDCVGCPIIQVNSQTFSIVQIPVGMETVTFVECE